MSKITVKALDSQDQNNFSIECPNCGSKDIITDESRGEQICSSCGFVLEDRMIDLGTEWRAYNQDEHEKRTRAEFSSYSLSNDLSTYISLDNKDALGKSLSPEMRNQFYRIRQWQVRIKNQESKDRNLNKANQELDRLCSQLDIPRTVKITAGNLYKKSFEGGMIRGFPINDMIAASVYAAARVRRVPRTLDEIAGLTQISKKRVAQCYRILVKRMNYKIPPSKPSDFLLRIGTELNVSNDSQRLATEIIQKAIEKKLTIGRDPIGLASAAIYLACIVNGEKRIQQVVAKVAHVTEVTIRHNYKELLLILEDKIWFPIKY